MCFELDKVTKNKLLFCLIFLMSIYIYIKSWSTHKEVAILAHHISTVAQIVDLLWVLSFYSDITACKM